VFVKRSLIAALATGALFFAACSSSGASAGKHPSAASNAAARTTTPKCVSSPRPPSVVATKVPGVATDWDLTSFDDTKIRFHWFPNAQATPAHRAPTILMGPGWGMGGDTDTSGVGLLGVTSIASLEQAGFNVLTWDPRGFGQSGGVVTVDSEQFEGRDVQKLMDWVATQPVAQLDSPSDPRVGMTGGSYGGGIQLVTAAIDCRVDAIVPVIAWHSLTTSLFKADTPKTGWGSILTLAAQGRPVDQRIPHAYQASITTGVIDAADQAWFAQRGPGDLVKQIKVPTFVIQGTTDNLFTLDEGITNYRILRRNGVPAAMFWFCGGHGVCLTSPGDPAPEQQAVIAWLDRYVKRDSSVDTGPRFSFVDQNGRRYTGSDYPLPTGDPVQASGRGTLPLSAASVSGPAHPPANSKDVLAGIAGPVTPAKASNAVDVDVAFAAPAVVAGAPQLTLSYRGTTPPGERSTRVFAQLVDNATGLVVGNQITPIPVTLDGRAHTLTVPLEVVAFTAAAGSHLTLQLVAKTVAYAQPRLGGTIDFHKIAVRIPVLAKGSVK
jgi:ABC-2 type transport system ATP-binding protein